jgi:hypothetical protein
MNDQNTPTTTEAAPAPALTRLVFACGAAITCKTERAGDFPVGKRMITFSDGLPEGTQRPKYADGGGVHCLWDCPCSVKASGAIHSRAWAPGDARAEPSFMVQCRIARQEEVCA